MKKLFCKICVIVLMLSICEVSHAITLRYALIVGNDIGVDGNGNMPFPPLKYAESEAMVLRDKLVELSNFDGSQQRTQLLVGAKRNDVKRALRALIRQKEHDQKVFGKINSLLLFYFTGHGLKGKLLLEDGPLSASELGAMLRSMAADFSVAVFDACYSGSLEKEALSAKGLLPIDGLNLFRELPQETLSTEGSIWYVSSGQGQASYEDDTLGGVFTHFFIEGLSQAPRDGPGITLDQVWDYARRHTINYTASRNHRQVPEKYISRLKASVPLYFSFPVDRSATLVLADSIQGEFLLSYAEGHLSELISKRRGKAKKLAVYPGMARLIRLRSGDSQYIQTLSFSDGKEVVLSRLSKEVPAASVGEKNIYLWKKGTGKENTLHASTTKSSMSLLSGLSYSYNISDSDFLFPRHSVLLNMRFDLAKLLLGFSLGYGINSGDFGDWAYNVHALMTKGHIGTGFDLKALRLHISAGIDISRMWQKYSNDDRRSATALRPVFSLGLLSPRRARVLAEVFLHGGPTWSPTVDDKSDSIWFFSGGVGLILYYRMV